MYYALKHLSRILFSVLSSSDRFRLFLIFPIHRNSSDWFFVEYHQPNNNRKSTIFMYSFFFNCLRLCKYLSSFTFFIFSCLSWSYRIVLMALGSDALCRKYSLSFFRYFTRHCLWLSLTIYDFSFRKQFLLLNKIYFEKLEIFCYLFNKWLFLDEYL